MSTPWLKFYPTDWRADPALRMCSIGARGLWMEMLCVMHEAVPRGSLRVNGNPVNERQLAALAGTTIEEVNGFLTELEDAGVFSRGEGGTIYSRRMVRDEERAGQDKANGRKGGHPEIRRGTVPKEHRVRRFRRSDAPAKAQRIFDRSNGSCHWCQKSLDPELYHIDHVVAVRDGGTNDESNLVAACPECNGERSMTWGRDDADLKVGNETDHKAQKPEARSQKPEDATASNARGARFPEFWAIYPNKVGKRDAGKAFDRALKRADFGAIMAGLRRYIAKTDDRPWCNPATWLNQDRWTDEPAAAKAQGPPRNVTVADMARRELETGKTYHERIDETRRHDGTGDATADRPGADVVRLTADERR